MPTRCPVNPMKFEVGTPSYGEDSVRIKAALSHLETRCSAPGGFRQGEPSSRMGWTFFSLSLRADLEDGIASAFGDMISRYKESEPDKKTARFLADYLESRGCGVKVRPA